MPDYRNIQIRRVHLPACINSRADSPPVNFRHYIFSLCSIPVREISASASYQSFFFQRKIQFRRTMASTNVSNNSATPLGTERRHPEEKTNVEEPVVAPDTSRFPKDLDGASHGPVWQNIAVPMKADPANNPSSEEWDHAKQAFKDTGLLKRIT